MILSRTPWLYETAYLFPWQRRSRHVAVLGGCGAGDLRVHGLEQRISGGPSELNLLFLILANSLRIPRLRRQLDVV